MHLLEFGEDLHKCSSDCSFKSFFSEGDQSLPVVGMNGFVVFAVCIAQDVDTAPRRDPGHDHTHDQVRPVRSQPGDETASHDDPEVRGEVVPAEGVRRADVDVRFAEFGRATRRRPR